MSSDTFVEWRDRQKLYTNWVEFVENVVIPLHWPDATDGITDGQREHLWHCWTSEVDEYKMAALMFAWARAFPEKAAALREADK